MQVPRPPDGVRECSMSGAPGGDHGSYSVILGALTPPVCAEGRTVWEGRLPQSGWDRPHLSSRELAQESALSGVNGDRGRSGVVRMVSRGWIPQQKIGPGWFPLPPYSQPAFLQGPVP